MAHRRKIMQQAEQSDKAEVDVQNCCSRVQKAFFSTFNVKNTSNLKHNAGHMTTAKQLIVWQPFIFSVLHTYVIYRLSSESYSCFHADLK
jgi:hypothetical protein